MSSRQTHRHTNSQVNRLATKLRDWKFTQCDWQIYFYFTLHAATQPWYSASLTYLNLIFNSVMLKHVKLSPIGCPGDALQNRKDRKRVIKNNGNVNLFCIESVIKVVWTFVTWIGFIIFDHSTLVQPSYMVNSSPVWRKIFFWWFVNMR